MGVGCDVNYYVRAEIFTRKDLEILMFRCPTMQFFCCIVLQACTRCIAMLQPRLTKSPQQLDGVDFYPYCLIKAIDLIN